MATFSSEDLIQIVGCSASLAEQWLAPLAATFDEFWIASNYQRAAFLAQVATESQSFASLSENLNYRPARLVEIWPTRFFMAPDVARGRLDATAYAGRPQAIANVVYAGRLGNGNEASDEGWRYRGRGLIQVTGKNNYARLTDALEIDFLTNPDLLLVPENAARSAGWFWSSIDGNLLASDGDLDRFKALTKRVNGAYTGFRQRQETWERGKSVLAPGALI